MYLSESLLPLRKCFSAWSSFYFTTPWEQAKSEEILSALTKIRKIRILTYSPCFFVIVNNLFEKQNWHLQLYTLFVNLMHGVYRPQCRKRDLYWFPRVQIVLCPYFWGYLLIILHVDLPCTVRVYQQSSIYIHQQNASLNLSWDYVHHLFVIGRRWKLCCWKEIKVV